MTGAVEVDRGVGTSVDIGAEAARFLDWHEARAHALGGRLVRELGDAVLLYDPNDRDPFWNRLSGVRLPDEPEAFDERMTQLLVLFAGLDRRPHLWTAAPHGRPVDLPSRLAERGFDDVGGGTPFVLVDQSTIGPSVPVLDGAVIETVQQPAPSSRDRIASEVAGLLVAAFRVDPVIRGRLVRDLVETLGSPELTIYVARAAGRAVAVAKRTTLEGSSYLSSIATRPSWQGRGLGRLVTAAACRDAVADGSRWTHLRVFPQNARARALYERLGFRPAGERTGDFLLTWG
jgi:ribosomal protein S18 acetylase RimI-like enzyme